MDTCVCMVSPFVVHLELTTLLISYEVTVIQLCPTLYNPMDCSPPGSSVHEFSRQEYWNGLPFPSPGGLPHPGMEPGSPALQADSLPSEPPGKLFLLQALFERTFLVSK